MVQGVLTMTTRRSFFLGMAGAIFSNSAFAAKGRISLGLQLYTVRDDLARDFDATINRVAAMGIRKVQTNLSINGRDAMQLRKIFDAHGLAWDSCHCSGDELRGALGQTIEKAKMAGLKNITCAFPLYPTSFDAVVKGASLDDWKRDADAYNRIAEQVRRAGMSFGYHNHNVEFRPLGSTTGYETLLKNTDPSLVGMEMDVGWVVAAGQDPSYYLTRYPNRYIALHLKDLRRDFVPNYQLKMISAVVGLGIVDWDSVLSAAKRSSVSDAYIELEKPYDPSPITMVKESYEYLKTRL